MQGPPGTFIIQPRAFHQEVLGTSPAGAGRAAQGRAQRPVVSVPRFSAPPRSGQEASAAFCGHLGIFSTPVVTHAGAQTRVGPPGALGHTDRYRPGELLSRSASHAMPDLLLLEPRLAQPSAKAAGVISSSCSTADTELDSTRGSFADVGASAVDSGSTSVATCAPRAAAAPGRAGDAERASDALATAATISLHESLSQLAAGLQPVPTEGSKSHHLGQCKPCAFVFKGGCANGSGCKFCHLCPPEEKKIRKKTWKEQKRASKVCALGSGDQAFAASGGGICVAAGPL